MKVAKCLFLSLILLLMVPGIAEALTVVNTHTSLRASKTLVRAGTSVKFSGKLSASHRDCYKHQSLKLYRNGAPVGTLSSGWTGYFSFTKTISANTTYTVKFWGNIVGMHPNQKLCTASGASATVKICVPHHLYPHALPFDVRATRTGCR